MDVKMLQIISEGGTALMLFAIVGMMFKLLYQKPKKSGSNGLSQLSEHIIRTDEHRKSDVEVHKEIIANSNNMISSLLTQGQILKTIAVNQSKIVDAQQLSIKNYEVFRTNYTNNVSAHLKALEAITDTLTKLNKKVE